MFFEEGHGIHTKIVTKIKADLANSEEIDKKYIEWLKFESNNLEIVFRYLIHSQCGEYSKNNYNVSKAIINNVNLLQEESIYLAAEYIVCILANKRNHEYGAVKKLLFERMENYPEDYYFYKWIEGSLFSEKQDRDLGIAGDIKDTFIRLLSQIENEMIANFHIKVSNRNINRMLWNFIDFEYNAEKIFQSIEKEKIIQWFQQQFSIHSALEYLQVATEYTHANTFRKNEYQIYNDFIQRLQLTKQLRSVDVSLLEQKDLINSKNVLRMYEQWLSENS
ncbi:MAG: hypothetical protein ACRDAO_03635 [Culicoidibacterales bacterium]